ncbi:MAG: ferrous iron efflux protein F [Methanosaeta sp. PtaU1.Bin112]|nr:MAG: ferrous iron efflux protein F [Methanosaeta sp. PtaU1.Bin112]
MQLDLAEKNRQKSRVALLSVISNATLVLLKLAVGTAIGSVSVISEAIHSCVDLLAATIALLAVRKSGKPADEGHPFGHGKVENISGTIEALLIFLAAGWIIFEAIEKLRYPEPMDDAWLGIAVMLISVIANIIVSRNLFRVGKETDSIALMADAWHLRTDIYTSLGVFGGLAVIFSGELIIPDVDLRWVDPVAAIAVALLIAKAAYRLTVESARDLVDVGLPPEEVEDIRRHISAFAPTIRGFHRLRTRKAGSSRFAEFHIRVDASMSVDESHRITDMVADSIKQHYPGTTVTIHIEPCNCALSKEGSCGCLLSDQEKRELTLDNTRVGL